MPPGAHTAVPLDTWDTATYTGLWNYLDYPAVVLPVGTVQESDSADDSCNAKYGPEDSRVYSLCMLVSNFFFCCPAAPANATELTFHTPLDTGPELYQNAAICIQLVGYRHLDEALAHAAAMVDSVINGQQHPQGNLHYPVG